MVQPIGKVLRDSEVTARDLSFKSPKPEFKLLQQPDVLLQQPNLLLRQRKFLLQVQHVRLAVLYRQLYLREPHRFDTQKHGGLSFKAQVRWRLCRLGRYGLLFSRCWLHPLIYKTQIQRQHARTHKLLITSPSNLRTLRANLSK
ncbi:hypothetical protein F444_08274, partial [Phytophthora nicotianae P1976]